MALPHMSTRLTTSKNMYEAAIVRHRNKEDYFRDLWSDRAKSFHSAAVDVEKKKSWESEKSFNASMDAWRTEKEKEEKKENLLRRRRALAELLQLEREELQDELTSITGSSQVFLEDMKERTEELRSAREEKRKKVAHEKLYEHWRANNPDIRQVEQEQHKNYVINMWEEQKEQRLEREEEERIAREEEEQEMEMRRLAAVNAERKLDQQKRQEEIELKQMLQRQITELKERDQQAYKLKIEEEMLTRTRWELENLETERKEMEERRKKMEFGRVLLRQHSAALKRKSQLIQQELEEDMLLMARLAQQEAQERAIETSRREKAKADAAWMQKVLEEQIRVEKAREAELDMLYQDEASRQWEMREKEWMAERQARQRLMKEVMAAREAQIEQKMRQVRQEQQESLRRREELLEDIDRANQLTRREEEQKEQAKSARKTELESQMTARQKNQLEEKLREQLKLEDENDVEEQMNRMTKTEIHRMKKQEFQPKFHGRRQAWH